MSYPDSVTHHAPRSPAVVLRGKAFGEVVFTGEHFRVRVRGQASRDFPTLAEAAEHLDARQRQHQELNEGVTFEDRMRLPRASERGPRIDWIITGQGLPAPTLTTLAVKDGLVIATVPFGERTLAHARFEARPYPFRKETHGQAHDPALHERFQTANAAIADIVEHLSQVVVHSQASEEITAQLSWLATQVQGYVPLPAASTTGEAADGADFTPRAAGPSEA